MFLEDELASKLEGSRVLNAAHLAEIGPIYVVVEVVKLRVIERVERLGAEFEARSFRDRKRLVQVRCEIRAPRANHDVAARVAESQVRSAKPGWCRLRESVSRYPLVDAIGAAGLRILHFPAEVWPDGIVPAQSYRVRSAIARCVVAGPWQPGLRDHGSGDFPSAQRGVQRPAGMCKEWKLVYV